MKRIVVILCAAASILAELGAIGLSVERSVPSGPWALVAMIAVALPYLAIIALAVAGNEARAYALAAGTALWAFLGLVGFAVVFTLFLGFAMGNRDQINAVLLLDAFVLLQIPLGLVAAFGYRRLPPERRDPRAWAPGIGIPFVVAVAVAASVFYANQSREDRIGEIASNQSGARAALEKIGECLKTGAGRHGTYPAALEALGPGKAACLDAATAAGKLPGYALHYYAGAPDAEGKIRIYAICAETLDFGRSGWETYVADETGRVAFRPAVEGMLKPHSCAEAWGDELLSRVKFCLAGHAAVKRSYPETLGDVGSGGTGCLAPSPLTRSSVSGNVYAEGHNTVTYRPGPKLSDGRIAAFELVGEGRLEAQRVQLMVDETGTMYAAKDRAPVRGDPSPAELALQLAEEAAAAKRDAAALEAKCDAGDAAACRIAGDRAFDARRESTAEAAWKKACAHGDAVACLLAQRARSFDVFVFARTDDRICRDGDAGACRRLSRFARDFAACEKQDGDGCFGVALRYARSGNVSRANQLWEEACKSGHERSCFFWRIRNFEYVNAMRLQEQCDAGEAAACGELQRQVAQGAKS